MKPEAQAALARYREATALQERIRREAEERTARIRRIRIEALAAMIGAGMSYREVAKAVDISAPRVQQLVSEHQ